jgi:tRNA uridine 5-carboxymethylaminomethyl modification enzyme
VIRIWPQLADIAPAIARQIETDAKYAVYLDRQNADVAAYRRDESLLLPDGFAYSEMTALSMEVRQKLESVRPQTLGQAGRIDGMTPAALTLLAAHIRRGARTKRPVAAER